MIEDVTGSTARNSRVALSGPNAVAIWQQRLSANEVKILSNYSTDGGVTWHGPQPVSADTWIQRDDASLAMSGRNVVATWWELNLDPFAFGFYSNYSSDGGATWHDVAVVHEPAKLYWLNPQVAISGSNAVAVFGTCPDLTGRMVINACRSSDGGATWSEPQSLSPQNAVNPTIAMSGSSVVAVWEQVVDGASRICCRYSPDAGVTWQPAQFVEDNVEDAIHPRVAVSASCAAVVWQQSDAGAYRIHGCASGDGGASWGPDQMLQDSTNNYDAYDPQVAVVDSRVVAAWLADNSWWYGLYSNHSSDAGTTWDGVQVVAYEAGTFDCLSFALAMSDSNAVLAFEMGTYWTDHVYGAASTDGGATWGAWEPIEDNETGGEAPWICPQVAASGARVVATWSESDPVEPSLYSNNGILPAPAIVARVPGGVRTRVGECTQLRIRIANDGDAPLLLDHLELAGKHNDDFAVVTDPTGQELQPGDSTEVRLRFCPDAQGARTATLLIYSNDFFDNPLELEVSGVGLPKASKDKPDPARMTMSYMRVDPAQVLQGQQVVISANVCNDGGEKGPLTAVMTVNGVAEQSQSVTVSGGSCKEVVFRVARTVPGTYQIDVNGMQGQFTVLSPRTVQGTVASQRNTGLGTGGIIAIVAIMAALVALLVYLFRRD